MPNRTKPLQTELCNYLDHSISVRARWCALYKVLADVGARLQMQEPSTKQHGKQNSLPHTPACPEHKKRRRGRSG